MSFFNRKPAANAGAQLEFIERQISQTQNQIEMLSRILTKWQKQKEEVLQQMQNQ